jgi:CheY-like chemotaxis protein
MEHQSSHPLALVVEDDAIQRELAATLLEESDLEVVACQSAEAALSVLDRRGDEVDLLFTDVQLAGVMTGADLAAEARDRNPNIIIIVTSGRACPRGLPSGARFLPKPWMAIDVLREAAAIALRR